MLNDQTIKALTKTEIAALRFWACAAPFQALGCAAPDGLEDASVKLHAAGLLAGETPTALGDLLVQALVSETVCPGIAARALLARWNEILVWARSVAAVRGSTARDVLARSTNAWLASAA